MEVNSMSIYTIDESYFVQIDTPNKAYWLGSLASDGLVYRVQNKWRFQFQVAEIDRDWISSFQSFWWIWNPLYQTDENQSSFVQESVGNKV
jgi:hypothetical protein